MFSHSDNDSPINRRLQPSYTNDLTPPTGEGGLDRIQGLRPVAVVLDVGLLGIDGIEVCRRMRARNDWTPMIFVTARDEEVDMLLGLELGADDYMGRLGKK